MVNTEDENIFEWVKLSEELAKGHPRSFGPLNKMLERPLIPLGCLATAGFITYGMLLMQTHRKRYQQYMMRGRIIAHGITAILIIAFATKIRETQKKDSETASQQ